MGNLTEVSCSRVEVIPRTFTGENWYCLRANNRPGACQEQSLPYPRKPAPRLLQTVRDGDCGARVGIGAR